MVALENKRMNVGIARSSHRTTRRNMFLSLPWVEFHAALGRTLHFITFPLLARPSRMHRRPIHVVNVC